MYIKFNSKTYQCECRPANTMVYSGLPNDFHTPVCGEIILCADDDFIMRVDNTADYLRQTFVDGILTLTNEPESNLELEIESESDEKPTAFDRIEAQITYTAMMTDTLMEV